MNNYEDLIKIPNQNIRKDMHNLKDTYDIITDYNNLLSQYKMLLEFKDFEIEKLKQKLENIIVPKFKSGTTLYVIKDNSWISEQKNCVAVIFNNKVYYAFDIKTENDLIYDYGMEQNLEKEEFCFDRKQEAKQALDKLKKSAIG